MTFLGIQFNSAKMTMEVTPDRLMEITQELAHWSMKKKATKKEIQSLAGKLQFIAKCCKHSRSFMSRILATLKGLKRNSHHIYLNSEFHKDVSWWRLMLPHFNSVSIILTEPWSDPDSVIATDACLQAGGGIFNNRYFTYKFPVELLDKVSGINQLECITIIIALKLWGPELKGKRFVINCDNATSVSVLNSGRAHEEFLQCCAREMAFLACKFEFEYKVVHIAGIDNRLPDFLSRSYSDEKYLRLFHEATNNSWKQEYLKNDCWKFSCLW